jgi:hypothetical protein
MHLDSASARSHAADLAALRAAAERLAVAEASRVRSEVRLESRPAAAPRLIVRHQGHAAAPIEAAFASTIRVGNAPSPRSTATTDHALAHRRPPDDWPVGTLLPAGTR